MKRWYYDNNDLTSTEVCALFQRKSKLTIFFSHQNYTQSIFTQDLNITNTIKCYHLILIWIQKILDSNPSLYNETPIAT